MKKAIFLDKDGTLITNVPYNVNPDLITLTDGAGEGLQQLAAEGYEFVVITNQQGVALGYFSENDLHRVKKRLDELLSPFGVLLTGWYYCPHFEESCCSCRKPLPGMLYQAAREYRFDLSESWMIGDLPSDIEAGKRAGCHTILFDKGYENNWLFTRKTRPDFQVRSLKEAASSILTQSNNEQTVNRFL